MTMQPPPCGEIDIHAFSQLFNSTANSYKLAFFQALLNTLLDRERSGARDPIIELRELATEMLALAWYPHNFFRLSFASRTRPAEYSIGWISTWMSER